MERWILVGGVVAIFLGLGVMGWHYQHKAQHNNLCARAEAHCGEQRL